MSNMYLARKGDKIYHISQVNKSDKLGYRCLCCGALLSVYKDCKKSTDHFQHHSHSCSKDMEEDVLISYSRHTLLNYQNLMHITDTSMISFSNALGKYNKDVAGRYLKSLKVDANPDILVEYCDRLYPIYLVSKNNIQGKELDEYKKINNRSVFVIQIKIGDLIDKYSSGDAVIDCDVRRDITDRLLGLSKHKTVICVTDYHSKPKKSRTQSNTTTLERKVPKTPYGMCSDCKENLELVVNTYSDSAKKIEGLLSEYIRDDKSEDKDRTPRYMLGAALLRCPTCRKVMTINCPNCASKGMLSGMKVLTNPKRQHTYICCERYVSFTEQIEGTSKLDKEDSCSANLVLYSDMKSQTYSEEFKRVGGLFNWLINYKTVNQKKKGDC